MATPSIYQQALGSRFSQLDPGLHAYFGAIPTGTAGVGSGIYSVAGSRIAWLRPVFAMMAWRGILFPDFVRDVPFTVVNIAEPDGSLSATRTFDFPRRTRRTRRMCDRMTADGERLRDRLGRRGGLEVTLGIRVVDGELHLSSERLALHLRRLRIPLPHWARVSVRERWAGGIQHVDVRIRMPLLGDVFRYAGSFTFAHVPLTDPERMPR
ncbi:DUF4166 domain-containing protein [Microbacterium sp. NPDC055910]|uniref:DUF4166 domain-containing protein n=1 Tax=Microbacterium sp. NPDC055910 TaxID=3345659 RepID=UPI0035E10471